MKKIFPNLFNFCADGLVIFSRLHGRQAWLIFLIIFSLIVALSFPAHSQTSPKQEIRGVWLTNIDSDVLFEQNKLAIAIDSLAKLNFNTLYPTVWNWGYTLYPSEVAEAAIGTAIDPTEGLQGRDILEEAIAKGHEKGMAVIPWFEFGFMAPADSQLAKRHPDWLTKRRDGSTIWLEGNVHKRVWLNALHPEVQQFMTDLMVEIVSKYDVDGIQIDDHFGFPYDFGYDDYTVRLYQQEHQGKLPPAPRNLKPTNNCSTSDRDWQEWTQWRANKISAYLKQLFGEVKKNNPKAIMAVSPNPQTFSRNCFLADWYQWERMGLVEELVLQVYRDNMKSFLRELSQPEVKAAKAHIPFGVGILSGLKGRPVPFDRIQKQVETVRKQGFAGVSFFFYESLWNLAPETPQQRQTALQNLFATPMKRAQL